MKLSKIPKNDLRSVTRKTSGKTKRAHSCANCLKNESALTKPKAPEKRISLKKGIVLNCFYIMASYLASKLQQQIKNISRKTKTNSI